MEDLVSFKIARGVLWILRSHLLLGLEQLHNLQKFIVDLWLIAELHLDLCGVKERRPSVEERKAKVVSASAPPTWSSF